MLMHHAYPQCGGVVGAADFYFLPPDFYYPSVGLIKPEKDGHQSRFTCPVFSEEGVYFSLFDFKVYPVVGHNTRKNLGYFQHFNS
jgi:hypothetical protein